jgi:amidase
MKLGLIPLATLLLAGAAQAQDLSPFASGAEQEAALRAGRITSQQLAAQASKRIGTMDRTLNAVIGLFSSATDDAWALDVERKAGRVRSPLHGLPILLKDNIEAAGALPTTAGSLALKANVTDRDAFLVRRLRDGGVVILGKANLSEWANYRSSASVSGWSAVGGLVHNPYALDRLACGSSAGSAAAVAAGYVFAAIGTETDGSVTCPAAINGVVGFKPTLGLVSRAGVVPISPMQDTAGPIARTVADAAQVLTLIAGPDPTDPATAKAPRIDYAAALDDKALKGARIGVMRGAVRGSPATDAVFEQALARMKAAGAVLVEVARPPQAQLDALSAAEGVALKAEFRPALEAYLAGAAPAVETRTLAALIAFDAATPAETVLFGQETFEAAMAPAAPDVAAEARATARRLAGPEGLDRMFAEAKVEAIVAESGAPAPVFDPVNGAKAMGSPSSMPAVAGYPHLTLPMGRVAGLPVGLSIIGPAWSDARVLSLGYAFEQAGSSAGPPPTFPASISAAYARGADRR